MSRRVVITGLGTVNPLGNNVETTWDNVKKGVCGIDEITRIDTTNHAVKLAGEVKDLDVTAVIDKKDADVWTATHSMQLLQLTRHLSRVVWTWRRKMRSVVESSSPAVSAAWKSQRRTTKNWRETWFQQDSSPFYIPMTIANMGAGNIAIRFGFKGICSSVVTACASGNNAIGDSFHYIRDGYADVMICGGSEAAITDMAIGGFTAMQALNTTTDKNRASIPFDKERAGFVMGEGAGALVLEEYEHAKARGAEILGEVVGYGATCDAYHITAPCPDGAGGAACMAMAVKDAGIKPEQVGYINAHGTSTHLNDAGETMAIKTTFGEHAYKLMVSSTKSMTGHLLGGSGAVEAVITALALHDGFIPATINYQVPDEECDLDIVPNEGRNVQVEYALSNSLGFGGHNASILLKKFEA